MCSPAASGGIQAGGSVLSAYGQIQQGKANENYYNYLGDQANKQAAEVDVATGEQLSNINTEAARKTKDVVQQSSQTISSQKAAMAANGIFSDSGSFTDIVGDSVDKQALDEAAVKFNADQEMWQLKRQAINQKLEIHTQEINYRTQAKNARNAATMGAISTLVGGAAVAASGGSGANSPATPKVDRAGGTTKYSKDYLNMK